jgi:hypothetical protein
MASTEDSVFVRLSLLQPAAILFAACAGTTAKVSAAIAAAPIIVLIMSFPHFCRKTEPASLHGPAERLIADDRNVWE